MIRCGRNRLRSHQWVLFSRKKVGDLTETGDRYSGDPGNYEVAELWYCTRCRTTDRRTLRSKE